jgi:predicted small secreted protein
MNTTTLIRRFAALMAAAITITTLASCNTTAGLGRDVEKAGHGIHRAAENAAR